MSDRPAIDTMLHTQPEPTSFNKALQIHPEYARLDSVESTLVHARQVLEATNTVRSFIVADHFIGKPAHEIFDAIHKTHVGTDRLTQIIAIHDPELEAESRPTLGNTADNLDHFQSRKYEPTLKRLGFIPSAPDFSQKRRYEMSMIRGDVIMGTPVNTLTPLEDILYAQVENFREAHKQHPKTDEEIYAFTIAAATLLDTIHTRPDGNGRSSEDWMVALQYELFDRDISKIKTWSLNGLRAKGLDTDDPQLQLSGDLSTVYQDREALLSDRRDAIIVFRQLVLDTFIDRCQPEVNPNLLEQITALPLESNERVNLLTQLVFEHPQILQQVYTEIITGLTNPEVRREYGLEKQNGADGVIDVLVAGRAEPYQYTVVTVEDTPMKIVDQRLTEIKEQIAAEKAEEERLRQQAIAEEQRLETDIKELLLTHVKTPEQFFTFLEFCLKEVENGTHAITATTPPDKIQFVRFQEDQLPTQQLATTALFMKAISKEMYMEEFGFADDQIDAASNQLIHRSISAESVTEIIGNLRSHLDTFKNGSSKVMYGKTLSVDDMLTKQLPDIYRKGWLRSYMSKPQNEVLKSLLEKFAV